MVAMNTGMAGERQHMELNTKHDSIEDVPEAYRELYTEQEGKFHLTGIKGVKTQADIDNLNTALAKERTDHKETKGKLGVWGDMDHTEITASLDRIAELEIAAEGKIENQDEKLNEMTEARVVSRLAPVQRENETLKTQVAELIAQNEKFAVTTLRREIQDEIRTAATDQKVVSHAMADIELLAQAVFERTDTGDFLTKENPYGITPGLDATAFFLEMQPKRPHWWPTSEGGGATGSDKGGFANNPFSDKHWNMTAQSAAVRAGNAEAMAKAVGTTVGGPRPVKA